MDVTLEAITPNTEAFIAKIARVSNPNNQDNPDYAKLIAYLIQNKHWSPFEHGTMTVRITTSRAIAAQILRHRSFSFQEYSQRYSKATAFEPIELRRQAQKNRQSSLEIFDPVVRAYDGINKTTASQLIKEYLEYSEWLYTTLLVADVAKETARFILPLTTQTTLYMSGTIRSWIHYIQLRDDDHVQKEHRLIAQVIRTIFTTNLPVISSALEHIQQIEKDKALLYALLLDGTLPPLSH